ncbi:ATP-grasp domain-containing protein [Micromonospora sp. WMMA1923]|uniref:ATP-grasp domain-containing protein n=1 Tax=Micromonospora sp. WMMA1923 TaxID=3404125 RepID=UPI003B92F708
MTGGTRAGARIALVTCTEFAELEADDRLVIAPLAARGVTAVPEVWDDPRVDWAGYDLVVLRSPWDYVPRRDDFVAWATRVPRLANPAGVVGWNTDKRYLAELDRAGVPTVPTSWVEPGQHWQPPTGPGEYVVKPAVSAGSQDTGRYDPADPRHRELAVAHVRRLTAAGRTVMVQPYLSAVDTDGETALLFLAGPDGPVFSHAIRKGPILTGPDLRAPGLYRPEEITARSATADQLAVAGKALATVPGGPDQLLYARVDLIAGPDGAPVLVELELAEPSLFLGYAEGAADRLAEAIAGRLSSSRPG